MACWRMVCFFVAIGLGLLLGGLILWSQVSDCGWRLFACVAACGASQYYVLVTFEAVCCASHNFFVALLLRPSMAPGCF